MDERNIQELKAFRRHLMLKRDELSKQLRHNAELWTQLREICEHIWEIDRALGRIPDELPRAQKIQAALAKLAAECIPH